MGAGPVHSMLARFFTAARVHHISAAVYRLRGARAFHPLTSATKRAARCTHSAATLGHLFIASVLFLFSAALAGRPFLIPMTP
ncbi:hypothetical protein DT070_06695 [Polaromonas sp. SP1]|nr:hypothetical protein DT070_06695 [Polaromonas sp. SP1]